MTVTSLSADALVAKAEECYAMGLIDKATLERVTRRAYSEPGYSAILDLPLSHEIKYERELRRAAQRTHRRSRLLLWLRRRAF